MELLTDLFFKTDYTNLSFVLGKIALFAIFSIVIIWLLWTLLSKIMYVKNNKLSKEYKLKLTFMWSLSFYYVIFSIYLFFFFKQNGIDSFQWSNPTFYMEISAHLITIIALIVIFLVKQFQLANSIK